MRRASRIGTKSMVIATIMTFAVSSVDIGSGQTNVQVMAKANATLSSKAVRCPWTTPQAAQRNRPDQLAQQVVFRMTLAEKLSFVNLLTSHGYENENVGVPRLCIPRLTLQDGPDGLSFDDTGVTQLPASLATAATFDPSIAHQYGAVLGTEAHAQAIDVLQAPNLNLDRVPTSGRAFEGYGEDPYLASQMGDAEIEGIQASGVMSEATHFTAYNEETDRLTLNQVVSERTLEEVYLAPFRSAVTTAHVASIMCAYGEINSVNVCQNQALFSTLKKSWGFSGFVRADLSAVFDPAAAFNAGLDAIKPAVTSELRLDVITGQIPIARLNNAVDRMLTEMFAFGMITHPLRGHTRLKVQTALDSKIALETAQRSVVLLKNDRSILPLLSDQKRSIAVIGTEAGLGAMTVGGGSSYVRSSVVSSPVDEINKAYGSKDVVSYEPASPDHPVVQLLGLKSSNPPVMLGSGTGNPPTADLPASGATRTLTAPSKGPGWFSLVTSFTPAVTSTYELSLRGCGDSWLYLDGSTIIADPGEHSLADSSAAIALTAGEKYSLTLTWYGISRLPNPMVNVQEVGDAIARAVQLAQRSSVAIVFVHDSGSETYDQPSLSLPGYEDNLISAVASANPDTIVVLNTSEPILMPWQSKVAAILEAWYPGEEDSVAIASILKGQVDPSGRLPVTFPASIGQTVAAQASTFPGVKGVVSYSEGLNIGYRYYDAMRLKPLYPFGYGLSYTKFKLSKPNVKRTQNGYEVSVMLQDTGARVGTDVVEAYLSFPQKAGEPLRQLKGFSAVTIGPSRSKIVMISIPKSAFEAFLGGHWQIPTGEYTISVGESSRNLLFRMMVSAP